MSRRPTKPAQAGGLVTAVALIVVLGACTAAPGPASSPLGAGAATASPLPPIPSPVTSPSATPAPPTPGGTVSLTDSDCQFVPPAEPISPGLIEITFVNGSSARGGFHIWRLNAGHTFAELAAFIAKHLEGAEQGVDTGPPPFAHQVTGPTLEPDATNVWQLMTIEAVYGVACLAPNETARQNGMTREFVATYAAGPIVVGSE